MTTQRGTADMKALGPAGAIFLVAPASDALGCDPPWTSSSVPVIGWLRGSALRPAIPSHVAHPTLGIAGKTSYQLILIIANTVLGRLLAEGVGHDLLMVFPSIGGAPA
jgi:hypothetical protein